MRRCTPELKNRSCRPPVDLARGQRPTRPEQSQSLEPHHRKSGPARHRDHGRSPTLPPGSSRQRQGTDEWVPRWGHVNIPFLTGVGACGGRDTPPFPTMDGGRATNSPTDREGASPARSVPAHWGEPTEGGAFCGRITHRRPVIEEAPDSIVSDDSAETPTGHK